MAGLSIKRQTKRIRQNEKKLFFIVAKKEGKLRLAQASLSAKQANW